MGIKSRLKVGIFFNARQEQGGLYHYALTLVNCLYQHAPEFDYFIYHATTEKFPLQVERDNWKQIELPSFSVKVRMAIEFLLMSFSRFGFKVLFKFIPEFREVRLNLPDVRLYVKPTLHVFQWNYPAIFPIHDLQHRLQPEFPEVSQVGEYRRREYMYIPSVAKAVSILTDSEVGKEDVIHCYGSEPEKIYPLPYIAPPFRGDDLNVEALSGIREKYKLPSQYFFYPAAFWLHKNHERLVRAIHIITQEEEVSISLVFAGSKNREYQKIVDLTNSLGLNHLVHFTGHVPDEDLFGLYQQALGLVMPTFFGPTNIPILEAWSAGCPVITSDLRGIREQVGDSALLVDPRNENELAKAIWRLYTDTDLRQTLIQNGKKRIASWTPQMFTQKLVEVIKASARNDN